jgi:hypothetical protein
MKKPWSLIAVAVGIYPFFAVGLKLASKRITHHCKCILCSGSDSSKSGIVLALRQRAQTPKATQARLGRVTQQTVITGTTNRP